MTEYRCKKCRRLLFKSKDGDLAALGIEIKCPKCGNMCSSFHIVKVEDKKGVAAY